MKNLKFILLLLFPLNVLAQSGLSFKTEYYRAADNWVAFPNKKGDNKFSFGFLYLDEDEGFTYHYTGSFFLGEGGVLLKDEEEELSKSASVKYRLESNTSKVFVLKEKQLKELGLPTEPEWFAPYKEMEDRAVSLVKRGYYYNHVGGSDIALPLLEEAYKLDPDTKGLGFELSFAYNATEDYKSAEEVLVYYLEKNPTNTLLYKEQVYALANQNKMEEAEKACYKSFEISEDKSFRSEMAFNIAQQYYLKKDKTKFKEWAKITKKYCPKESKNLLDYLDQMEKKLG